MTAEGKDSLNFIAGDNVALDIDFDSKAVKISATGGGAVTSVNEKTGDVVLTAEDVNAYTITEVDEKITDINNNKQDVFITDETMELSTEDSELKLKSKFFDLSNETYVNLKENLIFNDF